MVLSGLVLTEEITGDILPDIIIAEIKDNKKLTALTGMYLSNAFF